MYVKVYRTVFELGLSPNAMKVYLYLCHIQNCLHNAIVKADTVCSRCNIASRSTVFAALAELEVKGLLKKYRRMDRNGDQIANGYHVNTAPHCGKWFLAPVQVFKLERSAFAVFLFLFSCSNKKGRCFPSLTKIMAALNLACKTVIEAIRTLVGLGLVLKAAHWPGRHNLYIVKKEKKEDAGCNRRQSISTATVQLVENDSFIVAVWQGFVKKASSFCTRVLQKLYTSYYTHLKTQ